MILASEIAMHILDARMGIDIIGPPVIILCVPPIIGIFRMRREHFQPKA